MIPKLSSKCLSQDKWIPPSKSHGLAPHHFGAYNTGVSWVLERMPGLVDQERDRQLWLGPSLRTAQERGSKDVCFGDCSSILAPSR
ncbi:hypothetical protein A6R68_04268 [Neotoma lepida]|uniref:Uncharacterized protein n=1 Tax=Neotoma lepida TaxID=56216 RepID=A0A1A6GLT0_NEOLE|nr:hypothetical protein A6R68_04268 [Neotoma lepida]